MPGAGDRPPCDEAVATGGRGVRGPRESWPGKTLLLERLAQETSGRPIGSRSSLTNLGAGTRWRFRQCYTECCTICSKANQAVLVDDFHLAVEALSQCHFYPRSGLLSTPLMILASYAAMRARSWSSRLGRMPDPLDDRCYTVAIGAFQPADYRHLCRLFLGGSGLAASSTSTKIYRFAPKLNAHQSGRRARGFGAGAGRHRRRSSSTCATQQLASNVDLGEVQAVDLQRPARASTT